MRFDILEDRLAPALQLVSSAIPPAFANGESGGTSISADGRYVAFDSFASNLVPGDTDNLRDVFVKDCQTGVMTRVSVNSDGTQGNGESSSASISANGRYVAFCSASSNLVSGDTNNFTDVFVMDLQTNAIARVSVRSDGTQGDAGAYYPTVSEDGRYVAFSSDATNLVSGDTNNFADGFVKDMQTGEITRVTVGTDGTQSNADTFRLTISANGHFVVFESEASNLVPGDTNNFIDVFVKDLRTGEMTGVSNGQNATWWPGTMEPSISADGRYVVFQSNASNLVPGDLNDRVDVFVKDLQTGGITRVNLRSDGTQDGIDVVQYPAISPNGRYVTFTAGTFAPISPQIGFQVYLKDTQNGALTLVSASDAGVPGDGFAYHSSMSWDGRFVAFESVASFFPGEMSFQRDVFRATVFTGETSTTMAAASPSPSSFGQPVTLTAAVATVPTGQGTPTGTVDFFDGETLLGSTPLVGGSATFQISTLSVGIHAIIAKYSGDLSFWPSQSPSPTVQVVNRAATTTTVAGNPNPSAGGMAVSFTATIVGAFAGVVSPPSGVAGTVKFFDGEPGPLTFLGEGAALTTSAGITTSTFDAGTALFDGVHDIRAVYEGDSNYLGSAGQFFQVVALPVLRSVTVNGDAPELVGPQRSRVASLQVAFDQPVMLDANAMTLALHTNNVVYKGVAGPFGSLPAELNLSTTDNINWVLTFVGNTDPVFPSDGRGSLKDGVYDFKIDAARVHPIGLPGVNLAFGSTTVFHRLFGDADNGNLGGTSAIVDTADNAGPGGFRSTFNDLANYRAYFDYDGDGIITTADNYQFRNRFNHPLSWSV